MDGIDLYIILVASAQITGRGSISRSSPERCPDSVLQFEIRYSSGRFRRAGLSSESLSRSVFVEDQTGVLFTDPTIFAEYPDAPVPRQLSRVFIPLVSRHVSNLIGYGDRIVSSDFGDRPAS